MAYVRWMIRKDMPEVIEIEKRCFEFPWVEESFLEELRRRNCIGMVALERAPCERKSEELPVLGYMIYELHKTTLRLMNLAVAPHKQRAGVGRSMVDKLLNKLSQERRTRLVMETRESNTDAQMFFRHLGFKCVNTLRGFYTDIDEDAYVMQYRWRPEEDSLTIPVPPHCKQGVNQKE